MNHHDHERKRARVSRCLVNALSDLQAGSYASAMVQAACAVVHLAHLAPQAETAAIVARVAKAHA